MMTEIFREVDNPRLRMCLDVGHVNAYSPVPVEEWVSACAEFSPISISTTMTALRIPIAPRGRERSPWPRCSGRRRRSARRRLYTGSASGGTGGQLDAGRAYFGGVNMEEKLNKLLSAVSPLMTPLWKRRGSVRRSFAKPPEVWGGWKTCPSSWRASPAGCIIKWRRPIFWYLPADNGVVAEGVSSAPQSVTLMQTVNLTRGKTGASVLAKHFGSGITVCDGRQCRYQKKAVLNRKIAYGTQNIASGPAMTRQQAVTAILTGAKLAAETDADALGVGEMGIGNTTTSSAVLAVLLSAEVETVTSRGGGVTDESFLRKKAIIRQAIEVNRPRQGRPGGRACQGGRL